MKRMILVGVAITVTVLGVTQLGWASGLMRKTTLTPGGSVAFDTFKDIEDVTGSPSAPTVVTSTSSLGKGSYVIQAKVVAFGSRSARVVCQLQYPGWSGSIATTDQGSVAVGVKGGTAEDQTMSLLWATTWTGSGNVRLVCWPEEVHGPPPGISDASLLVSAVSGIST